MMSLYFSLFLIDKIFLELFPSLIGNDLDENDNDIDVGYDSELIYNNYGCDSELVTLIVTIITTAVS